VRGFIFCKLNLLHIRRNKSLLLRIFHHADTTRSLLNRVPNFQQTTFAVLTPLAIPETQRLDALIHEKFFPCRVAPDSFRQTMLKTVQLDGELCLGAVEIQNVIPDRVLAAEFETGKTPATQRPPKFLLLIRLLAAKFAGDLFEAHGGRMLVAEKNSSTALATPSPLQTRNIPQKILLTPALSSFGEEREKNSSQRLVMDVLVRGGDESLEQRMWLVRFALEFRMKLARHKKRMVFQFDDFNEFAVG
jgi:hypothetical protein